MEKIKKIISKLICWQYFPLLVLVAVILGLHLATITHPPEPLFDEQHYVPDARRIITGEGTQRVEHPPLAKLIVAGGIELFGDNPWGWRLPAVLLSTLTLIAFYDICRKLGTSHKTAFIATLLLGTENLMFIHSGMAMLDIYVIVFTIFAFWLYLKGPRWWWASAVSVALAALCKFSGILSVIPIGLHWFIIGYKPNMGNPAEPVPIVPVVSESTFLPVTAGYTTSDAQSVAIESDPINATNPHEEPVPSIHSQPVEKPGFWAVYGRPTVFILSVLLAPIAFFVLYGVFEMAIWSKYIPLVVWGHWDQGIVGDIRTALSMTSSIKFGYDGAFPARPWEWILSPTGSLYFYGWLFHPENYKNILLPYWYTPSYTGLLSPSLWISGFTVIPFAIWKSFKQKNNASRNAWIFTLCWIVGTWLVWVPLFLATNRITYMFYYLPTVGAIALGTALVMTAFLNKAQARVHGFRKRFLELSLASFLTVHLLSFCVLSPLKLWLSMPACALLLAFALSYLGLGRRFIIQFFVSGGISALIMRFMLYWPLKGWLVTDNAPWGLPEVSLLWVVSAAIGMVLTWILFGFIHRFINRVIKDNALPQEYVSNLPSANPPTA